MLGNDLELFAGFRLAHPWSWGLIWVEHGALHVHSCSQFSLKTCSTPVWLCLLSLFQVFVVVIHQFFKSVFSKETHTVKRWVFLVHIFWTKEFRRNLWRIPSQSWKMFFVEQSQFRVGWVVVGFVVGWIWIKPTTWGLGEEIRSFLGRSTSTVFWAYKTQPNFVWGVRDVLLMGR